MTHSVFNLRRLLAFGSAAAATAAIVASCQSGNIGSPGNTPNIPPQSSYRVVGDVGTPFSALVSDSRSSWQISAAIPMNIVVVNDSPPDRISVTKLTNDQRLLSVQVIQGFGVATVDSTISRFGTAVGSTGGATPAFAIPASPDVRYVVKTPLSGLFNALIEDETMSNALESQIPAIILFDSPNKGQSGRVDGTFNQVSFAGVFNVDLLINGQLGQSASGGNSVTVQHGG